MLWECQNVRIFWNEAINRTDVELNTELPRDLVPLIWVSVAMVTDLSNTPSQNFIPRPTVAAKQIISGNLHVLSVIE